MREDLLTKELPLRAPLPVLTDLVPAAPGVRDKIPTDCTGKVTEQDLKGVNVTF